MLVEHAARVPEPQSTPFAATCPLAGRSTVSVRRTRAKSAPAARFDSILSAHDASAPSQAPLHDASSWLRSAVAVSSTSAPWSYCSVQSDEPPPQSMPGPAIRPRRGGDTHSQRCSAPNSAPAVFAPSITTAHDAPGVPAHAPVQPSRRWFASAAADSRAVAPAASRSAQSEPEPEPQSMPEPVTRPCSGRSTVSRWLVASNDADTRRSASSSTVQDAALPEHAPPQPAKRWCASAAADSSAALPVA